MASTDEIKQVWNLVNVNYPSYANGLSTEVLKQQLALWQKLLADLDGELIKAAALQHIAASKWFPTVAELRTLAVQIDTPNTPAAIEGWGEVTAALSDCTYYRYADGFHHFPKFSPVTQRVVDAMGWGNLCASEDGTADRARFLQAYEMLSKRASEERLTLPLVRDLTAKLTMQRSGGLLEAGHVD